MRHTGFLFSRVVLLILSASSATAALAADTLKLNHQPVSVLTDHSLVSGMALHETNRSTDRNNTLHVRFAQTYKNYPVLGAEGILHIPHGNHAAPTLNGALKAAEASGTFMNGNIYQNLSADLNAGSAVIFTPENADNAIFHAVNDYSKQVGVSISPAKQKSELAVFIDKSNKAHWVYQIHFSVAPLKANALPAEMIYILDANTFVIYEKWNNIQTIESGKSKNENVDGGGYGGNIKMGEVSYDGETNAASRGHQVNDLPVLKMTRDASTKTCYLQNNDVTIHEYSNNAVVSFSCKSKSTGHKQLYWNQEMHEVNGGYSPDNDAFFGGAVIKDMYKQWYNLSVLVKNGKPLMLDMVVHMPVDNAYWSSEEMIMRFGDGEDVFYPLTSLGVAAHEISHGFTQIHSNLQYDRQSGGMNEAYSDMAAQAAEFYAYGKNSWMIGPEIFKGKYQALRYMDKPSKDCDGRKPGNWCSIDTADQYSEGLDVHYSSGIYNRVFYLMGTTKDWNAKKAFDVMLNANVHYWTAKSTFSEGACGVIHATKDLGYDENVPKEAFNTVKVDISGC